VLRPTRIPVVPLAATSAPTSDQGWIYELLRWMGVSPDTAHHVQSVLVRPLTVVAIVILGVVALWLGDRAIRRWIGGAARKAAERADSPRGAARATTITTMLSSIWWREAPLAVQDASAPGGPK